MYRKDITAVFPGSFDPITNGHIDVIERGLKMFSRVVVAVGENSVKTPIFTGDERVEMIRELFEGRPEVVVEKYDGLTVEYVKSIKADVMLRGLRNLTDVQYEFQLAMTNRSVAGIETVFVMTSEQFGFVSSTLIREMASLGGDVSNLIPHNVFKRLQTKTSESS
ncbi:pantetheine-phosphate adenylyltransferase [Sedimentisphaera salicampi]|uniref:Phosphopantetheine adenylyltransferase n=1 Tax=Sedimentisphaera salicampi TaxID=1941349 RepID=A0A1W6LM41_9BACT|nr:pantetheine-phosphate adenylyltransferase [Sedimentisphaera salicampi]ARN56813.1 Phosphopantetheine adenylyltransferase [Sedimentisphaera salicampi]OXU14991.1 Phosphopantetheine adenylyltransferase [Sedimentisphaera salicampi]